MITQYLTKKINIYKSLPVFSQNSSEINQNSNQSENQQATTESTAMISVVNCIQCHQIIGIEDDIFQVPGAAGSIGAYVNPHGSVIILSIFNFFFCNQNKLSFFPSTL